MTDVSRVLTLVNGSALHKALREAGVGVSYRTVARWVGPTPTAKPPADVMPYIEAAMGITKESPPAWAEGLAQEAAEAAIRRLVTPEMMDAARRLLALLEDTPPQQNGAAPEEDGSQDPAAAGPQSQ